MATVAPAQSNSGNNAFKDKEKPMAVRNANIMAARVIGASRHGQDGTITNSVTFELNLTITDPNREGRNDNRGFTEFVCWIMAECRQTNDGNTMLRDMSVMHPAAKMLVDLSAAQDVEAGDGTTSVVVIAGSLLGAADKLLAKGSHDRQSQ
ncbi:MAG: hypothetical protein Q9224_006742 [Gallowayella concinna]